MTASSAEAIASQRPEAAPTQMTDADDPNRHLDRAMERYVDGDLTAFDQLYAGLERKLFGFLFSFVRDRTRAEDLLQVVFMKVHAARGAWLRGGRITPYVFAIARNAALDQLPSKYREAIALTKQMGMTAREAELVEPHCPRSHGRHRI